jgi:hypothetical protein
MHGLGTVEQLSEKILSYFAVMLLHGLDLSESVAHDCRGYNPPSQTITVGDYGRFEALQMIQRMCFGF